MDVLIYPRYRHVPLVIMACIKFMNSIKVRNFLTERINWPSEKSKCIPSFCML